MVYVFNCWNLSAVVRADNKEQAQEILEEALGCKVALECFNEFDEESKYFIISK